MKRIDTYISEKLHINKATKLEYMYHPKTKDELIKAIQDKIDNEGYGTKDNPLDLNDIDTSKITDMSMLFNRISGSLSELSSKGYFDISEWDVSNVENMIEMFANSHFKGDISKWDVSKVKYMKWMFAESEFNGDLSGWDVSNVLNMTNMFFISPLEKNPPKWYKPLKR